MINLRRYCGVGSRSTSLLILELMTSVSENLASKGWILHSGGADGADLAFEKGCDQAGGLKEIFLPWEGFNGSTSTLFEIPEKAFSIVRDIHPAWDRLKQGGQKLRARNAQQVLGKNLNTPVELVICWTEGGKAVGGTATAINLALREMYYAQTPESWATLVQIKVCQS